MTFLWLLILGLNSSPSMAADTVETVVASEPLVQSFTEITNKSFSSKGKVSDIQFDASADCETTLSLHKLAVTIGANENDKLHSAVKIDIVCQRIVADAKFLGLKDRLKVSENFVVTTGDDDLKFSIEFPVELSASTKAEVLQASLISALKTHPVKPGTGLNLDTVFISNAAKNSPTVREDIVNNLTQMAYDDRLETISKRIGLLLETAIMGTGTGNTPAQPATPAL